MKLKNYKELEVWQKSMVWVENVYRVIAAFPKAEQFGLISQLRRAVISVPCNVAEGAERRGTKEFLQFIGIARGSLAEAETLIQIATRLKYLSIQAEAELLQLSSEIGRMLHGLERSLESKL